MRSNHNYRDPRFPVHFSGALYDCFEVTSLAVISGSGTGAIGGAHLRMTNTPARFRLSGGPPSGGEILVSIGFPTLVTTGSSHAGSPGRCSPPGEHRWVISRSAADPRRAGRHELVGHSWEDRISVRSAFSGFVLRDLEFAAAPVSAEVRGVALAFESDANLFGAYLSAIGAVSGLRDGGDECDDAR